MTGVAIIEWRPVVKNSLRGFCTARFPSGMVVHDIAVHISHGTAWASPPSKPQMDRTGQLMRDDTGKQRWQPIISFASKAVRDQWSSVVIEALRQARPDALAEAAQDADAYASGPKALVG